MKGRFFLVPVGVAVVVALPQPREPSQIVNSVVTPACTHPPEDPDRSVPPGARHPVWHCVDCGYTTSSSTAVWYHVAMKPGDHNWIQWCFVHECAERPFVVPEGLVA